MSDLTPLLAKNWSQKMHGILILIGLAIYIRFVFFVVQRLAKKQKNTKHKNLIPILAVLVFSAGPFWDVPLIQWEFDRLCKAEAGVQVYEKVVLGPEYWKENGSLKPRQNDIREINDLIPVGFKVEENYTNGNTQFIRTLKAHTKLIRIKDQKVLGDIVIFSHGGSWLHRNTIGKGGGGTCPNLQGNYFKQFTHKIFQQQSSE